MTTTEALTSLNSDDLYENPVIANNTAERDQNAIEYVEVRLWSVRKAAMKAGIERTRLRRLLKNGLESKKVGRKRILSEEGIKKVHSVLTDKSLHLVAPTEGVEFDKVILKEINHHTSNNSLVESDSINVSRSTMLRIKKSIKSISVIGDIKSKKRKTEYENIRNPLSLCAVLDSVFDIVEPELFFSSDDVSVLLNGWDKPKVITTLEAKQIMDELNIGVSITEEVKKRRVITFNITVQGNNRSPCMVIKIIDKMFTEYKSKPKVFNMSNGLYVLLASNELSDTTVTEYMYKKCIVVEALKCQENAIERDELGFANTEVLSSQSEQQQALFLTRDTTGQYLIVQSIVSLTG